MNRRQFLGGAVSVGGVVTLGCVTASGGAELGAQGSTAKSADAPSPMAKLTPPNTGPISVAFLISEGANVIDTMGPWEVFQDTVARFPGASEDSDAFRLFTVAERTDAVRMTGGLRVTPEHDFANAPHAHVIVVPASRGSAATTAWLAKASASADMTMSVCTGAFQLARAGLLDGLAATTHHDFWDDLASSYPKVDVRRGPRFVESGPKIATAGGLTSGVDLALRIVERYFGRDTALRTARYMEHESKAWQV